MSDRNSLLLPERAFGQLTQELNASLRRISRRIKWSSSTADDFTDGDQELTVRDWDDAVVYETIASINLDPGRWVIMAQLSLRPQGTFSDGPMRSEARVINGVTVLGNSTLDAIVLGSTDVPAIFPIAFTSVVVLAESALIELEMWYANQLQEADAFAVATRLTAIPG